MSSAPGAAAAAGATAAAVASPAVDSGGVDHGEIWQSGQCQVREGFRFPSQHEGREGGNSHAADAKQSGQS